MKKQRGCWFQVSNFSIRVKIKKAELTVELKNLRAISFYKKIGFEIEGVRKKLLNNCSMTRMLQ